MFGLSALRRRASPSKRLNSTVSLSYLQGQAKSKSSTTGRPTNMASIARNLSAASGSRYVRASLQISCNVRWSTQRQSIPAMVSLCSSGRMMSLCSTRTGGSRPEHAISVGQSRWFSAAVSVPANRSMSGAAKSGGDSFAKICFIGAGKMAER